jgi:uracil-DNA glycosylase family 4
MAAPAEAITPDTAFAHLVSRAGACRLCPRMEGRTRVLSEANGSIGAEVLFVAEAPGRLGGERSGVPLSGDQAGRNFEDLLRVAGLDRALVFVTNAVLCNPQDERGRNASPAPGEMRNCSPHLRDTIDIVDPRIVVALGQTALRALALIEAHDAVLARGVRYLFPWYGRLLMPLYHPGSRARVHRSLDLQREDFLHLRDLMMNHKDTKEAQRSQSKP